MSIILKTLLKSMSSKLLIELILLALDRVSKKDYIDKDVILSAIACEAGCKVEVKK